MLPADDLTAVVKALPCERVGVGHHTYIHTGRTTYAVHGPAKAVSGGPKVATVAQGVAEYLATRRAAVVMGRIKSSTIDGIVLGLGRFERWVGALTPIASIDEATLTGFYNHLAGEIEAGRVALGTAKNTMLNTKAWVRKQWEARRIELPRNLGSRDLCIRVDRKAITVLDVATVRRMYEAAPPMLKLCILLSLNCGFNQVDISNLRHAEVDWTAGTITRKRSKTADHADTPTVRWRLWPITLKLLKEHRMPHPELVLLSPKGRPLIHGSGLRRWDRIAFAWKQTRKKLGLLRAEYRQLRRTAATMLGSHPTYGRYAQYFLCHARSNVADAHYVKPDQASFDGALAWLEQQFFPEEVNG